ncbi:MAG: DegT/DnrJ/EryC1/StrS family aminotransferase [Thermodesulfobacteriota bacterium]
MNIPFLDLITPHRDLEEEFLSVFRECLRNASFVGGSQVQGFEEEFAQFCETKHCIAVNSGTDALRFALIAAGIGPGDQVITVPNTFIATTEAISQTGAEPVFVDIDEKTYNMDPNRLEDYLRFRNPGSSTSSRQPRAVLPVHLYGQPADMDSILQVADRHGLIVIEDACQAHGALYYSKKDEEWKKAGSMGLASAFSFYPGKNLGACGEGGAVVTHDGKMAQKIRMLRDHGQAKKYYHDFEGYNGRLDAIQCGILRIKLKHLSEWNEKRRRNASLYTELLTADSKHGTRSPEPLQPGTVVTPHEPDWVKAVYHLYIVRTEKRDELQKYLSENGISTGLHYPIPLHLQDAYKSFNLGKGDYPVTERVSSEILSLPMFPDLTNEQIEYVAEKIREFYALTSSQSYRQ